MKKIAIFLVSVLLFNLVGCSKTTNEAPPKNNAPVIIEKSEEEILLEKVNIIMSEMTLEEKIAQMLVVQYSGDTVDDKLLDEIQSVQPGGFILFANNITTYEKTEDFVNTLQNNSKIPMIISVDQEGGKVQRIAELNNATYIPDMYSLGLTNDYELAYEIGAVMAKEMRTIGINTVFAPVTDILSNKSEKVLGTRSFGSSAELVSKMAVSVANGLEDNGVIATYKHFPGLGATTVDSHESLPVVNKTLDDLKLTELIPYKNAIGNNAKIIMVGHIALPNVTGDKTPASLSKVIVTDVLRGQLGFDGLIITDALNMGALTENYSNKNIYLKAIDAGCDLLLMPENSAEAVALIKNNVSEERINESVKRILIFKLKYLEDYEMLDASFLGCNEHKNIVDKVYK
ncbi:MAG: beta-N-acetylhexosaminidase [Clostridia bacterium]|nr:beta-N-acetylhexosaminidase [Clostridia bacterium]